MNSHSRISSYHFSEGSSCPSPVLSQKSGQSTSSLSASKTAATSSGGPEAGATRPMKGILSTRSQFYRLNAPSKNQQRRRLDQQQVDRRLASLTIADLSPRLALQRILALCDKGDYREAAAFVKRLSSATFRQVVAGDNGGLPMDRYVDSMPQSLPILEAVYGKLFHSGLSSNSGNKSGDGGSSACSVLSHSPETVVWQIVRFFVQAQGDDGGADWGPDDPQRFRLAMCGPWVSTCKRLLSVLLSTDPTLRRVVQERQKALAKAVEGLGQHGLVVGSAGNSGGLGSDTVGGGGGNEGQAPLMHLQDALRTEFERVQKSYTEALSKLEVLCFALFHRHQGASSDSGKMNNLIKNYNLLPPPPNQLALKSPPPVAQSHQRQLSLRASDVQDRLIKNKSLLNCVDQVLNDHNLKVLVAILQRRIELDKEALFQFTQIRKEFAGFGGAGNPGGTRDRLSVAPLLMRYQRGCQQVLDLMQEVAEGGSGPSSSLNCDPWTRVEGRVPLHGKGPHSAGAVRGGGDTNESGGWASSSRDATSCQDDETGDTSDSDSAVMMSGNSPYISKTARCNFLFRRSVRNNSGGGHLLRVSRPSSLPEEGTTRIDVDQAYPAHRDVSESSSSGGGRRSYPTSMLTTLSHTPTVSSKVRKQLQQQQQQLGASGPKIRVDAGMGSNSSNCSSSSGFSSGTATNGSSNNSCRVVSVLQTSGSDDSDGTSGKAVVTTRAVIRINGGNDPPAAATGRNDLCSHIRQVPSEVNNVVVDGGGTESSEDCSSGPPGGFRGWPGGSLQRPSCSSSSSASSSSFDNPSSTFSSRSRTLVASEGQGQQLHRDDELVSITIPRPTVPSRPTSSLGHHVVLQADPDNDDPLEHRDGWPQDELRIRLEKAYKAILDAKAREKALKERVAELEHLAALGGGVGHHHHLSKWSMYPPYPSSMTLQLNPRRGGGQGQPDLLLIRRFADLFSAARDEALEALDTLDELNNNGCAAVGSHSNLSELSSLQAEASAEELKNKLLFSVIVLSFRSVSAMVDKIRVQMGKLLQLPTGSTEEDQQVGQWSRHRRRPAVPAAGSFQGEDSAASGDLEEALNLYLRRTCDKYDISQTYEDVCAQLWATLYDYPGLKSCQGFLKFVKACMRVSWGLVNQRPQYVLDYEGRTFQPDLHTRYHISDPSEDAIKTYLWPALRHGSGGPCVQKAVVIT